MADAKATSNPYVTGPLLAVLFVLVFGSVLLLISALQLQRSVQTINDPTLHPTLGSVRQAIKALNALDAQEDKRTRELEWIRQTRPLYASRMTEQTNLLPPLHRALEHAVYAQAQQFPDLSAATVQLRSENGTKEEGYLTVDQRLSVFEDAVRAKGFEAKEPRKQIEKFLAQVEASTTTIVAAYTKADKVWDDNSAADQKLKLREDYITKNPVATSDDLKVQSFRSVVEDFRAYESLLGRYASLVMIPNAMLVLLLSICMGMLGSLIYLARKLVLDGEATGFGEIVSRVGLGAAVALALFFFAAAGMLAMSQSTAGPGSNDMSPYLIAFLGITAGYLSDRVTAWMREVGERTFKLENGDTPNRWAVGLESEVKMQNMTSAQLASGTDNSGVDVDDWIALRKSMPGGAQRLISTYLRVDPSKLFTDVKPRNAAA
jgi:hypothetical protein